MPKRKTNSSGGRAVATVMLLAALGVGVFAAYVRFTPAAQRVAPIDRRADSSDDSPPTRSRHHDDDSGPDVVVTPESDVKLRVPTVNGLDVKLDGDELVVPKGVKPMVFIANETLKVLKIDKARAIGVDIKGKNALVDFNSDLEGGYGSMEEGTLIKALQTALGQFPEIDTFQMVVDGTVVTTLGQVDLSDPIPVIRPGQTSASSESTTSPPPSETGPEKKDSSKPSSDPKAPPED